MRCPVSAEVYTTEAHSNTRSLLRSSSVYLFMVYVSFSMRSHLLTHSTSPHPSWLAARSASRKSCCATPSLASMTSTTMSARRMACSARPTARDSGTSPPAFTDVRRRMPAVSISVYLLPSGPVTSLSMVSRVVPLWSLTMVRGSPASWFSRLLLPTLGRPMMATLSGPPSVSSTCQSSSGGGGAGRLFTRFSISSPVPVPEMADTASGVVPPRLQKSMICSSPLVELSHLFTARCSGVVEWKRRIQPKISMSAVVRPCWPSVTMISACASRTASAAWLSTMPGRISTPPMVSTEGASLGFPGRLSSPPVSTIMNSVSPQNARTYMRSRVTPGWSYTMARFVPVRRLKSADFPTLGRPTMATRGSLSSGILPHSRRVLRLRFSFVSSGLAPPSSSSSKSLASSGPSAGSNS
mmetsp:Transcript_36735/g.90714  ORF Transcript_36735/g.90714 Transcript_36735/m.90714 type:complete len:411 (+) Transcript_36735:593-1825(+)